MDDTDLKTIQFVARKNKLKEPLEPKRFTSGIINRVYELAGQYILKIEGEGGVPGEPLLRPAFEMTEKLLAKGAKVPKILDYDSVDGTEYILMEKIAGTNISSYWMKFTDERKEKIIAQLAEQLQIWHSITFDNYSIVLKAKKSFNNLRQALDNLTIAEINAIQKDKLPKEFLPSLETLEKFYYDNVSSIDETGTAVLCHNDIHLENIFSVGDTLTGIIDMDWISQAPKDYDLWKIMDVIYEPKCTVEGKLQPLYEGYQMTKELNWLKKYYPALFAAEDLAKRVRLYYASPLIESVIDYQNGKYGEKVINKAIDKIRDFYQNSWLDNILKP